MSKNFRPPSGAKRCTAIAKDGVIYGSSNWLGVWQNDLGQMSNGALPIPVVALDDCGAILGRRGAGKSATKTLLFEHELDLGRRCCLVDPKGDGWGIRLNPNGSPSRFQSVAIFGGEHGDISLEADMGKNVGELIAKRDLSCIVDLSSFSIAGMRRFMSDFAETLYENNRAPLTLFVDEADQLAPQRLPADMAMLLHRMERLIRMGRQRGIFMWMMTQRPQLLNKNLLSQAETLIAMKMTTPHDRKAIRDWMEAHDPEQAKEVEANLAKLHIGEAYVWVPPADFLERIQFPLFSTFDSGRTPKHGERIVPIILPQIDVTEFEQALDLGDAKSESGDASDFARQVNNLTMKLAAMESRALTAEALIAGIRLDGSSHDGSSIVELLADERNRRRLAEEQLQKVSAEAERLRRIPTYFDATTGRQKADLIGQQAYYARLSIEKGEKVEAQLREARATVERQQKAIETLGNTIEAETLRRIKAERAFADIQPTVKD